MLETPQALVKGGGHPRGREGRRRGSSQVRHMGHWDREPVCMSPLSPGGYTNPPKAVARMGPCMGSSRMAAGSQTALWAGIPGGERGGGEGAGSTRKWATGTEKGVHGSLVPGRVYQPPESRGTDGTLHGSSRMVAGSQTALWAGIPGGEREGGEGAGRESTWATGRENW